MPVASISSYLSAGVQRDGVDEPWATIRGGAGTSVYAAAGNYVGYAERGATPNQWSQLIRLVLPFDTSVIGPGQIIDSATITLFGFTKMNAGGVNKPGVSLYRLPPSATPQIVQASDYERITATSIANTIAFDSWQLAPLDSPLVVVNVFTLNATGLAQINPLGWTTFAGRFTWDADNLAPGDWNAFSIGAWTGDVLRRPILDVTYHVAPAGPPTAVLNVAASALGDRWDVTAIVEGDAP